MRDVFAIYDDDILSRLIMIIIKIIILYFIQLQIRHTDDFPSAGIPANVYNTRIYVTRHEELIPEITQHDQSLFDS